MKKLTLTLLALVCALCCALGLVACNDGETPDNTGNGGTQTVAVTGVTLNKNELTLEIGGEETLTATVAPDNATDKTVTWSSSAPTIATVANGKVTAVAEGTATITATTANNKTATCAVTVNAATPTTEVTAEQWAQNFEGADINYTYEVFRDDTLFQTTKIADGKTYMSQGNAERLYVKEGSSYYLYVKNGGNWSRQNLDETTYTMMSAMHTAMVNCFKDDYSSFTYADGVYAATTLDKTETLNGTLNNIIITFEDGKVFTIEFDTAMQEQTVHYVISDIGSTTIEVPVDFTVSNS